MTSSITDRPLEERPFWKFVARMEALAAEKRMVPFDVEARRWRFEVPLAFWEAAKAHVEQYGWKPDKPPTGESWPYLIIGYPFVVDPNLRDDELRLVERRSSSKKDPR